MFDLTKGSHPVKGRICKVSLKVLMNIYILFSDDDLPLNLSTKNRGSSTRPSGIWSPGSLCEQEETKYSDYKYHGRLTSSPDNFSRPDSTGTGLDLHPSPRELANSFGRRCSSSASWDTEQENASISTTISNGKGDLFVGKITNGRNAASGERSFQVGLLIKYFVR